jgi:hypothetical protein
MLIASPDAKRRYTPLTEETLLHEELRDGYVSLKRDTRDDGVFLLFYVELNTRHPADVIFRQLVLGLTESEKSWLWPIEYEKAPEPPEGGPAPGCICRMTYRVPRFDRPEIPAKPVTYTYVWPQYDPQRRLLEYRSVDHPLEGGAVVQVLELGGGRSRLVWDGAYKQLPGQDIVVQSMVKYIPPLYHRIEDLIEAGPERLQGGAA